MGLRLTLPGRARDREWWAGLGFSCWWAFILAADVKTTWSVPQEPKALFEEKALNDNYR